MCEWSEQIANFECFKTFYGSYRNSIQLTHLLFIGIINMHGHDFTRIHTHTMCMKSHTLYDNIHAFFFLVLENPLDSFMKCEKRQDSPKYIHWVREKLMPKSNFVAPSIWYKHTAVRCNWWWVTIFFMSDMMTVHCEYATDISANRLWAVKYIFQY